MKKYYSEPKMVKLSNIRMVTKVQPDKTGTPNDTSGHSS